MERGDEPKENKDGTPDKKAAGEKFAVTARDLHKIRLKPTQTKVMDPTKRLPVNQSPICSDCMIQKDRLKHIT
jgi:hypothetical protein